MDQNKEHVAELVKLIKHQQTIIKKYEQLVADLAKKLKREGSA